MIKLVIPGFNNGYSVSVTAIIRVEAAGSYSRIYFSSGRVSVVPKVLLWFEDELPVGMFARVHRSHLVNKMFVKKITGIYSKELLLLNGERIAISRRRYISMMEV